MDRFTRNLALAGARHPWRTIASWVLVVVAMFAAAAATGGAFADDFASPGSQSARAMQILDQSFPQAAKGTALVVFEGQDGTTIAQHRQDIEGMLTDVDALERGGHFGAEEIGRAHV